VALVLVAAVLAEVVGVVAWESPSHAVKPAIQTSSKVRFVILALCLILNRFPKSALWLRTHFRFPASNLQPSHNQLGSPARLLPNSLLLSGFPVWATTRG
jgi:hypothetical protein